MFGGAGNGGGCERCWRVGVARCVTIIRKSQALLHKEKKKNRPNSVSVAYVIIIFHVMHDSSKRTGSTP